MNTKKKKGYIRYFGMVSMATMLATLIGSTGTIGATSVKANDFADTMPDISDEKVMVGYLHNWKGTIGYKGGQAADMELKEVQKEFNVVDVSFMKSEKDYEIPTFKPDGLSDTEFRSQVSDLNKDGRVVLLALGGADGHVVLKDGQQQDFANEIIRQVETYGFDGLDIDLEQTAITAADNPKVITEALKIVKNHYARQGKNFIISMAPEFPYLQEINAKYKPYLDGLEGYYDFIAPQFYNQGGDGVWVDEINKWVNQSDDVFKEEFLYYMADSIINGTRGYIKIPADKLAIGLPTNNDAAASGYVIDPQDVYNAYARLEADGNALKGIMTWSANWDAGHDSSGKAYNNEFTNRYAPLIYGNS